MDYFGASDCSGPALHLLEALGVLAFDIDFLNLGCVLPDAGPSITFLSQLMAYPAFSLCMFVVWWCIGRWGGGLKREELFNINGLVLMTLYVTLTIVSLLPWQCISNPNGTLTMQTQPGVICFNSEEHTTLMFLSILGMLMNLGQLYASTKNLCLIFCLPAIHLFVVVVVVVVVDVAVLFLFFPGWYFRIHLNMDR